MYPFKDFSPDIKGVGANAELKSRGVRLVVVGQDILCLCCDRAIAPDAKDGLCPACLEALEELEAQQPVTNIPEPVTNRVTKCTNAPRPELPAGIKDTPGARAAFDSLVTAGITGATEVTGERATVIGQQTVGLSSEFVRELLAAKDRQIETLLALVGQLKDEAAK